jgi:hypothetical protein
MGLKTCFVCNKRTDRSGWFAWPRSRVICDECRELLDPMVRDTIARISGIQRDVRRRHRCSVCRTQSETVVGINARLVCTDCLASFPTSALQREP